MDRAAQESLARLRRHQLRHVLFVCVANSARSQMAEGIARSFAPEETQVSSAGSRPGRIHPLAVRAMEEIGIDIRDQWSKGLEEVDVRTVDAAITLCAEEECPLFPAGVLREHWPLPDPVVARSEALDGFRAVRDELRRRISALFREGED
jgi:arsenate reductase